MVRNGCMKREEETMMIPICDRWLSIKTTVKFKNDKLKKFRGFFFNFKVNFKCILSKNHPFSHEKFNYSSPLTQFSEEGKTFSISNKNI